MPNGRPMRAQIIAAPKKLDETGIGSRACEAGVEVEESF